MQYQKLLKLCGMKKNMCTLFQLYTSLNPEPTAINRWFSEIDFEALPSEMSAMAASIGADTDYAGVPESLVNRLRGISRYIHTLNTGMAAGLCALNKQCNRHGLQLLLSRSSAIQMSIPEHPARSLWHMDTVISEQDFDQVIQIAEDLGYSITKTTCEAIAKKGNTQSIHIQKSSVHRMNTTILAVNGTEFLIPTKEELLVDLCEAATETLSRPDSPSRLLPWLMDIHSLIQSGIDEKQANIIALERRAAAKVQLILLIYHQTSEPAVHSQTPFRFSSDAKALRLANRLQAYRSLRPEGFRLRRHWLYWQIQLADSPIKAFLNFHKSLLHHIAIKLTQ